MEVVRKGEGGDKSPLIKAMSAEQGLVQNLNQFTIQPQRKKMGTVLCLHVHCNSHMGYLQ